MQHMSENKIDISKHQGLVHRVVKQYSRNADNYDDLFQEGMIGLWMASQKYDASLGKFSTYAYYWIRMKVQNYANSKFRPVHIPHNIQYDAARFNKKAWIKYMKTGKYTKPKEVENLEKLKFIHLDSSTTEDTYDTFHELVGDASEHKIVDFMRYRSKRYIIQLCENLIADGKYKQRDWDILRMYYGLDKDEINHTFREIGLKYGVTRQRIEQSVKKSLGIIRTALKDKLKKGDMLED